MDGDYDGRVRDFLLRFRFLIKYRRTSCTFYRNFAGGSKCRDSVSVGVGVGVDDYVHRRKQSLSIGGGEFPMKQYVSGPRKEENAAKQILASLLAFVSIVDGFPIADDEFFRGSIGSPSYAH